MKKQERLLLTIVFVTMLVTGLCSYAALSHRYTQRAIGSFALFMRVHIECARNETCKKALESVFWSNVTLY